jgi:hypothetical protein
MKLRQLLRPAMIGLVCATMFLASCAKPAPAPGKVGYYPGTLTSLFPNYPYPAMNFTATSQTVTQALSGVSFVTIEFTATTCTPITWQVKVSNDGGTNYVALPVAPYAAGTLSPSTSAVTLSAATTEMYVANVAGFTNIEIVTSSTFTATGVNFYITGTSNHGLAVNVG